MKYSEEQSILLFRTIPTSIRNSFVLFIRQPTFYVLSGVDSERKAFITQGVKMCNKNVFFDSHRWKSLLEQKHKKNLNLPNTNINFWYRIY